MHRFYIAPEQWDLEHLQLDLSQTHHCIEVVRLQKGNHAIVFNGCGMEATVEITGINKKEVQMQKLHHLNSPKPKWEITLGQAIPKGKNMDLIVQKATELGAAAVAPLCSGRSVVQCNPAESIKKQLKWKMIAIEAAKQCGQNWLPTIHFPQTPEKFLNDNPSFDLKLIAAIQPNAVHLKKFLKDLPATQSKDPFKVLILIGPEGDFTPTEYTLAQNAGCRLITLGPIILRTETAALYCLSVLSHELHWLEQSQSQS